MKKRTRALRFLHAHAGLTVAGGLALATVIGTVNMQLSLQATAAAERVRTAATAQRAATTAAARAAMLQCNCSCTSSSSSSSSSSNSSAAAATSQSDFTITEIYLDPQTASDTDLPRFSIFVTNSATPAPASVLTVTLDMDLNLVNDYTKEIPVRAMGANEGMSLNVWSYNLGWDPPAAGHHQIKACIDNANTVPERNENNNCKTLVFDVTGPQRPDFKGVEARVEPQNPSRTSSIHLTGFFTNFGTISSPASSMEFSLDSGNDGSIEYRRTVTLDPMNINEQKSNRVSASDLGWTPSAGTYKLKICTDPQNQVQERRENNNCSEKVFTVSG